MELLYPGSVVHFCNMLSERVDGNLIEEIVATIDPEEIVAYIPDSALKELSEAVNYRINGNLTIKHNFIDQAQQRDLKMLCTSLVKRLKSEYRLNLILDELERECDLTQISINIAQRIARIQDRYREDLKLAGLSE